MWIMTHVLHDLHHELEYTHDLAEKYHYHNLSEIWHAFIWKSFKKALRMYALQKEHILMSYATLHYDIETEVKDPYSDTESEHVSQGIKALTESVDACSQRLSKLLPHGNLQKEIIDHEKKFFLKLLESLQNDIITWVSAHERDFFGTSWSSAFPSSGMTLSKGHEFLKMQKAKLDWHINNISK